jgi:hypothetical protein
MRAKLRHQQEVNMTSDLRNEPLAATADCSAQPSAPANVSTGQNVRLTGTHNYRISNPGDDPITVMVEAVLEDSRGHKFIDSQPVTVSGHASESKVMNSFLTTSYDSPGDVLVTARSRVTGDAFCSSSSGQNMHVR